MNSIAANMSYEGDLVLWFEQQAAWLRARQFSKLDVEQLVEELEAMAGRDRRELRSRLRVLIAHLLKCTYQPSMKSRSWLGTIRLQRQEIRGLLEQSPSLRHYLVECVDREFAPAADLASDETGIPVTAFPRTCPYMLDDILDDTFIP